MDDKRPTGHGKRVGPGSAHVGKGDRISSRPVGTGSGRMGSFDHRSGDDRGNGGRSAAGKLGLLALLLILPKKYRRLLIIGILIVAALGMLGKCGGSLLDYDDAVTEYTLATDAPYYTEAPAATSAPAVTQAPAVTAAPVTGEARAKRVVPKGNGDDVVTVMIYLCGTDLESKYGMGTSDLNEMIKATISDQVNVIVETGGCKAWKNSVISSSVNQIYQVQTGGLKRLESNFGTKYMTDPANLTEFIRYCVKNYPADRNILIFWDHGGGSLSGYGYDEKQSTGFTSTAASMTLPQIESALKNAGCVFDWIGFDACLMATLETAMVCNEYADYMIASEESEPGTGWYYTDWLTVLSNNTSASTESIGKVIVDTFVTASQKAQSNAQVTLSVIDLAQMQGTVPQALRKFSTATTALIQGDGYKKVAQARANARQFARQSRINQVDMIDLCDQIGTVDAKTLSAALRGCVAYNKSTISRANGISVYFPYETLSGVKSAVATYNSLGIDSEYTKCIQSFASVEQGGQFASSASQYDYGSYSSGGDLLSTLLGGFMDSGSYGGSYGSSPYGSSSPLGSLTGAYTDGYGSYSAGNSVDYGTVYDLLSAFSGRSMPAALDWVDTSLVAQKAAQIAADRLDPARITVTDKKGVPTLVLTDGEWALIDTAAVNVFVDDGQGFIDLGYDNYLEYDADNDLMLTFDGTWLCMDGNVAAFYMTKADETGTYGRIPALVTRTVDGVRQEMLLNLIVFIDRSGHAEFLGADPLYENETETQGKGAIDLEKGDMVQLLCDYYTYDGAYEGSYALGSPFTVGGGSTIGYLRLDNVGSLSVSYRLTDVYGNVYWTPANLY